MPERRQRSHLLTAPLAAAAALSIQCSSPPPSPAPPAGLTAYRNFTLYDGTGRGPLTNAAMVVENGRVAWTGPAAALAVPAGVTPVDFAGGYVMPGLIDLHGHLGNTVDLTQDKANYTRESVERDLATYAAYGVTTVQSMGTDQDAIFAVRNEQRAGRPTRARVYTAGQGIVFKGGYGGLAGVNQPVATVAEAEQAVNAQADKGVDVIKLWLDDELGTMPKMPVEMSRAIIDAAHKRNLRVVAHVFYLEDARRLVDQDIDGFVHGVRDRPLDPALIAKMKERRTWQLAGTLSREASMFAYGTPAPFLTDPFFTRALSPGAVKLLASAERQKTVASGPNFGKYPAFLETAKQNYKMLVDAGVEHGTGTDSGPPGRFPGFFEHWELELMVQAGLTPRQALTAATRHGAEWLRSNDLGTLDIGKWADFLVLEADPLADIKNTRRIRAVYIAGQSVTTITQRAN
jgi:imidazolonepropionase-like amidohydrolase